MNAFASANSAAPSSAAAPPRSAALSLSLPPLLYGKDLHAAATASGRWLWYGYLAPGSLTLLSSQWKSGKTTLVSILLARLKNGGMLADLPLAPGKAVVVSEEDPAFWYDRSHQLDFGDHVGFLCRPFKSKPTEQQWRGLIEHLVEYHSRTPIDLVVIDPLAAFLPVQSENAAAPMIEALMWLRQLTSLGLSVLLLHHPPKGEYPPGQGSRGSGALPSHVDILIEMRCHGQRLSENRRRRLLGFARHRETPRQLVIEWTADGTDYVALGSAEHEGFFDHWEVLKMVLEDAPTKLTRQQILEQWPADFHKPDSTTLWHWLRSAVTLGRLRQGGTGRRSDPFRYWLAERDDDFPPEGASPEELQAWNARMVARWVQDLQRLNPKPIPTADSPAAGQPARAFVEVVDSSAGPPAKLPGAGDVRRALDSGRALPLPEPETSPPPAVRVSAGAPVPPCYPATPNASASLPPPESELSIEEQRRRSRRWPG